ncbi:MAG: DUF559 domain-containing protein, partial [Thermodesulfobacteriota bacterium]
MKNPLRDKARTLRNNLTDAEAVLWSRLKSRQVEGVKFRRQTPLVGFIVDFVSFERGIVIEVDGGQRSYVNFPFPGTTPGGKALETSPWRSLGGSLFRFSFDAWESSP